MTKKLLIVDDDPGIVAVLFEMLTDEGYVVETAVDGAAVRLAPTSQPDLILLDVMMPIMNGVEVSKRLKSDPVTQHIPIIAMSAGTTLRDRYKDMRADDFLAKPFEISDLLTKIKKFI